MSFKRSEGGLTTCAAAMTAAIWLSAELTGAAALLGSFAMGEHVLEPRMEIDQAHGDACRAMLVLLCSAVKEDITLHTLQSNH